MIEKLRSLIMLSPGYQVLIGILKSIKLKKRNTSLYNILVILINKIWKDELIDRSYGVAFSFTLAIFPLIIFLFTLLPYIHQVIPEVDAATIMDFLESTIPPATYATVSNTIEDIVGRQRGGLLSFGFFLAIFLATNGMLSLINVFNKIHKTVESRGFLKTRLIATGLTFMLASVLLLAAILLIAAQIVVEFMLENGLILESFHVSLFQISRFTVILIIFQLTISCIYYFGPAVHDRLHFFSPGSIFATFSAIGASFGFSYYVTNFGTYNKLYGSIGALIAMMLWLSILSLILLVGFELNASIDKASRKDFVT